MTVISRHGVSLDPGNIKTLTDMLPTKKMLQSVQGIVNYLGKFSPIKVEICKPLWRLISVKAEWI